MSASTASDPVLAPAGAAARRWRSIAFYLAVGLVAGALIALQLAVMRVFAVGSWAHVGSMVVSLAMLGFGLTSAVLCIAKPFVERHGARVIAASAILFGPLVAGCHLLAQQVPFNPVFMIADPMQKWRLAANFVLYLLPFLAGASFLGTVFIGSGDRFGRVYFADLTGAGLCGLVFMLAMYLVPPEDLIAVPLAMGLAGAAVWLAGCGTSGERLALAIAALVAGGIHYGLPPLIGLTKLAVSDYKGVAYVRKFPDNRQVYHRLSPFGDLQIYASSFLHFAPGLSDNAAFNLPAVPANAYLGLYVDGDGPSGVIRDLPAADTAYFRFLPMAYPYLLKRAPDTFVVQFAGGISTAVALRSGARSVTLAEANPTILSAFAESPELGAFTGHVLDDPRVRSVDVEGRLYLRAAGARYDVVDLSLASSAGLSSPGGFPVVERYGYTREAMLTYMRALKPGGVLSVTLWNKEEPPRSVLKLYATMVAAARAFDPAHVADSFVAVANYLSTTTVLYKRGGFTPAEVARLRDHGAAMSFDELYDPGIADDPAALAPLLSAYREQIFGADRAGSGDGGAAPEPVAGAGTPPATDLYRLAWAHLVRGDWAAVAGNYVFDVRPPTDDRPYFAGYIKTGDLLRAADRLEPLQDEWGYLLLWATLAIAVFGALVLVALPVVFGWRMLFERFPGKVRVVLYFACLGLGYIVVEVGMISKFVLALSSYTISAAVVVTAMLVFSGIGSFLSQRVLDRAGMALPPLLAAIGGLLIVYALVADRALDTIGSLAGPARLLCCFAAILPAALLMGFPMPLAMGTLARLGKDRMFVWAWGINGCFSVVGAALVPIVATSFGLDAVLLLGGGAYLAAIAAVSALFLGAAPVALPRSA